MIALVDPDEQFKRLDFSSVVFPSDGLSVGVLRKLYRGQFDHGFSLDENGQPAFFLSKDHGGLAKAIVGSMLYFERVIAASGFAVARGIDFPDINVSECKDELAELYMKHGLAAGMHHAMQLIRDIEKQGTLLASQRQP